MCRMCGKFPATERRWYEYDNGEQFIGDVCVKCAKLHDRMILPICGDCLLPLRSCSHAGIKL